MAHPIKIITERELKEIVRIDREIIDVIERAFAILAKGDVIMPPILSLDIPAKHAEVDVKTAYIPGFDGFAIKVSPGFFNNPQIGLPSLNGLMVLFSAETGLVQAMFLDNGYLTDIRTAAAGAVAARHLAPKNVSVAGVIGTGLQARLQLQAAHQVRPFKKALIYGRTEAHAQSCADDVAKALGVEAEVMADAEALVAQSQLVITTTPSREPIIQKDWLHEGLHITAMGSDQVGKNEIAPEALAAADLYVCDRVSQCAELGELASARAKGLMMATPPELGAIITGAAQGRQSESDITLCDLTGTGVQDTAIASHVYANLGEAGTVIES